MSVLKRHRSVSKMEYVNTANQIYLETLDILSRLSARYARLLAEDVIHLASAVLDHSEQANSIYPGGKVKRELREGHLVSALAALNALDVHLEHVYNILMLNPQGAFTDTKGNKLSSSEAIKKLDHMADSLGTKIDLESDLLKGVLNSDRSRS